MMLQRNRPCNQSQEKASQAAAPTSKITHAWTLPLPDSGGLVPKRGFFDVWVFNPSAPLHQSTSIHALFRRQEKEKRREYEQRVLEIERGSFAPLIFSTSGGMGPTASVVYKRLASLIAAKRKAPYSRTMT